MLILIIITGFLLILITLLLFAGGAKADYRHDDTDKPDRQ
jgi:hypothetical protein